FRDHAADAGDIGMSVEERNGGSKKVPTHLHVAVDEPDISPLAVLETELSGGSAGAVLHPRQADDLDRILAGDFECSLGRRTVRNDDLRDNSFGRRQCALDRRSDMPLLVERLDDDADRDWHTVAHDHETSSCASLHLLTT